MRLLFNYCIYASFQVHLLSFSGTYFPPYKPAIFYLSFLSFPDTYINFLHVLSFFSWHLNLLFPTFTFSLYKPTLFRSTFFPDTHIFPLQVPAFHMDIRVLSFPHNYIFPLQIMYFLLPTLIFLLYQQPAHLCIKVISLLQGSNLFFWCYAHTSHCATLLILKTLL